MKILIYSQHFWPENFRINDVAEELSKKHIIYVISAWPNYNIVNKKKVFKYGFEKYKNINIIRVPTIKRYKNRYYNIIFNYLSFIIGSLFIKNKRFQKIKFDAVISYATSPIYQAIPAIIYSKRNKIPFFLWVQDLWPNVLKDLDILNNTFFLKILNSLTNYLYKKSDFILAQSPKIRNILKKKYKNTFLVYNPSNIKRFKPFKILKNKTKKIIFAGNIGKAQALEKLIYYGKLIKKEKIPIKFEIIGDGSNKLNLQKIVKNNNLKNIIIFKSYMNSKDLEKSLMNASGLLVSLGKGEALSVTIPAKFQTYISYGKPIFSFSDNIIADIIKKNGIGFVLKKNNSKKIIYQFLKMNIKDRYLLMKKCKNLYLNYFEIQKNTKELEKLLKKN